MERPVTRAGLLSLGGAAAGALLLPSRAAATRLFAPVARGLSVKGAVPPYGAPHALFTTISPGVGGRDRAVVTFTLDRPATVRLEALRITRRTPQVVWRTDKRLREGFQALAWEPGVDTPTGSHVMRLTLQADGKRRVYGARRPSSPDRTAAPVVHLLGVEAAFLRRSFVPEERMPLRLFADTPSLRLTFLRCGPELEGTDRIDVMHGVPMGEAVTLDWSGKRARPVTVTVQTGDWPSGLYAARLETPDGRLGFAPFVLRAKEPGGASRAAVVLPTHTWQAYNFDDRDGDGWGDTWYAGGDGPVALDRPYRERGVPPRFRRYDLPFLKWLARHALEPEFLADDDLDATPSGDELRRRYDVLVFPGHTEYVTQQAYDVLVRFRDLGGRLVFLSANNVFWKVTKDRNRIRRVRQWRDLGRPEARLLGVQYRANDDGTHQGLYNVVAADKVPWLFEGTDVANGSAIGAEFGGYGIEIDQVTPNSPPGTVVIALVPALFGPGLDAHMTYYETEAGARVFSAGTLDFAGSVLFEPIDTMLANLWRHMLADLPPRDAGQA